MSADETKKTPDVEAAAAPEKDAPKAAGRGQEAGRQEGRRRSRPPRSRPPRPPPKKAAAGRAKKAAKKAAAKPAAKKAGRREGRPPRSRPPKKPAAKAAAKPAAKKAAPAKPAKKSPVERPAKVKAEKKALPESRHGKLGVATVVDAAGKELETRELSKDLFAVPADVNTLHLVVRAEQAARRRGTASSKTRGEVSGSTGKLYRQKGTGRARAGSVKSPLRTGGGVTFGPRPRSFDIKVNRKVVRKALAMALSNRAENGNVFVAAGLTIDAPSTATMDEFLVNLDIAAPVLVVTHDEPTVAKSVRNLRYAESSEVGALSTEQVLRARSLVLTEKAFAALNEA